MPDVQTQNSRRQKSISVREKAFLLRFLSPERLDPNLQGNLTDRFEKRGALQRKKKSADGFFKYG